jgi:hypothetical protein
VSIQQLRVVDWFIGRETISHRLNDSVFYRLCSKPPDRPDFGLPSTQ